MGGNTSRDQVLSYGHVGVPTATADGSDVPNRLGKFAEQIIAQAHGKYYEAASRGKLMTASTAVAGVAPGTALSTTPPMALWNPTNSGLLIALKQVFLGYVSGTLGAGSMLHAQVSGQTAAPTGGTELTPVNNLLGTTRGTARAFQGSTVANTPTIVRASGIILGASLASTAALPAIAMDEVDGSIVIPPGGCWAFQGLAAAGSSPLVLIGAVYEEIAIP